MANTITVDNKNRKKSIVSESRYGDPITISRLDRDEYPEGLDSLAGEICGIIRQQFEQRQDHLDKVQDGRDQYESVMEDSPDFGPYRDSARIHTPMTRSDVTSLQAQTMRVITGVDPFAKITAQKLSEQKQAEDIEDFLQFGLENDIKFRGLMDKVLQRSYIDGVAVVKTGWAFERARRLDRKPLTKDLLREMGFDSEVEKADAKNQPVTLKDGGDSYEEGGDVLVEDTPIVRDNPYAEYVNITDFVFYPVTSKSIDAAVMKGNRLYKTKNDLLRGVRDGMYDKEAVEKVIKRAPTWWSDYARDNNGSTLGWREAEDIGLNTLNTTRLKHVPYECFEVVYLFDYDGDGIEEDCLFTIDYASQTILRAIPLPYWDGSHHYVAYAPIPRTDTIFGYSVPEILSQLQDASNVAINQRIDAGSIANSPIITELDTSNTNLSKTRLTLGEVFRVTSHDDIKIQPLMVRDPGAILDINLINAMSQEASGVSDAASGMRPQGHRPLGETEAILEQAGYKFQMIIDRVQDSNILLFNQIVGLYRQFMSSEKEYALTGHTGIFKTITPEQMRTSVSISAHGNTINTNRDLEAAMAEKLVMLSEKSPFMQKPTRMYQVQREFLRTLGKKDYQTYLGSPQEAEQMEQQTPPPSIPEGLKGTLTDTETLAILMQLIPNFQQSLLQAAQIMQQPGVANDAQARELENKKAEVQHAAVLADQKNTHNQAMTAQQIAHDKQMASQEIANRQQSAISAVKMKIDEAKSQNEMAKQEHLNAINQVHQQVLHETQNAVQQGQNKLSIAEQRAANAKQAATKPKQ